MDVPYEKQFHFRDGASAANLEELKRKIESISYQEFYHHVNAEKNDFANWVQYVLKQEELAADLRKVTSIVETVEIINDFLHPQPITATRQDTQSRIEQTIFTNPLPADVDGRTDERIVVEQVPTTAPAAENKGEMLDFKIIEEKAGISRDESKPTAQVQEELFGKPQEEQKAKPALAPHDTDATRMIVKDFMYGLVFGLLIGLILGRIIS
jgi:hypothetical protein